MPDFIKFFIKLKYKVFHFLEILFNRNIIFRSKKNQKPSKNLALSKNINYWKKTAKEIVNAANLNNGEFFFLNKTVINHLASQNSSLGYRLLSKINLHANGKEYLYKITTPCWGSPFLLKKFPFLSPTTASHLVNLLSIEDCFKKKIQNFHSFVDFGGGYGGLAQCINSISKTTEISIVDIPEMNKVQKKYLTKTGFLNNISFFGDIKNLPDSKYDIFNVSFSMSEVNLKERKKIQNFIEKNCLRAHIIFQENFNGIDNLNYFENFAFELKKKNWEVNIKSYNWYEWPNTKLFYITNLNFFK